ncbi:MAG: hypothetical protein N3A01_08840 [Bacteroidales bacterium]|nr:hypothetical protein [Bacteroidales bacterium]
MKTKVKNKVLIILSCVLIVIAYSNYGQGNSGNNDKITICHYPPGNPNNPQTITISINALEAHLAHGDYIGPCKTGNIIFIDCKPNPYQEYVKIEYTLQKRCSVKIDVYNVYSKLLKTLVNSEKDPGCYEEYFSGKELGVNDRIFLIKGVAKAGNETAETSVWVLRGE